MSGSEIAAKNRQTILQMEQRFNKRLSAMEDTIRALRAEVHQVQQEKAQLLHQLNQVRVQTTTLPARVDSMQRDIDELRGR